MQQLGIQGYCDLVQNVEFEKPISVVSMMDVVEHIPYPKEVLLAMHSKMDKDGCLLISCPNSESWVWKFLTKQNINPYLISAPNIIIKKTKKTEDQINMSTKALSIT